MHPEGSASGLLVCSWAESKCLQYEMQAWLVWILVNSIFQKSFFMENKQMPESMANFSWHLMKGCKTSRCMALGSEFRQWTSPPGLVA